MELYFLPPSGPITNKMLKKIKSEEEVELIFVYNASSDFFSRLNDFAHKIISPQTYSCNLCQLTFGNIGMHMEWAEFIKELPYKVKFHYKDQWLNYHHFPVVLLKRGEEINTVVSPEELHQAESLKELIDVINEKLKD
jgi:hypothetical protein